MNPVAQGDYDQYKRRQPMDTIESKYSEAYIYDKRSHMIKMIITIITPPLGLPWAQLVREGS